MATRLARKVPHAYPAIVALLLAGPARGAPADVPFLSAPALSLQQLPLVIIPLVILFFIAIVTLRLSPVRRSLGLPLLEAQHEADILLTGALLAGIAIWILDALLRLLQTPGTSSSFWELAVTEIPPHSLIMRELVLICALIAGLTLARGAARHARLEHRLAHINRHLAATSAVNRLIARETRPEPLLQGACDALQESAALEGAWIIHCKDVGTDVFHAGMGDEFKRLAGLMALGELPPCVQRALDSPSVAIIESTDTLCFGCTCKLPASSRSLCVRIEQRNHAFGVLTVIVSDALSHSRRLHEMLLEVAGNLGAALSAIRMRLRQEILQGKYQAAMASTADAVVAFEQDGRITAWNPGAESLFGFNASAIRGRSIETIIADEELESQRTLCLQAMKKKSLSGVETRRLHRDGHSIPVEMSLSQGTTRSGRSEGFVAVFRDISERKRSEGIQRRQLRMIRELADAGSVEEMFSICLETAVELASMDRGAVYRQKEESGELILAVSFGDSKPGWTPLACHGPDSAAAQAIAQGRPLYPCPSESAAETDRQEPAFLCFVPVLYKGRPVAALSTAATTPRTIRQDTPAILEMIAGEMSAAYTRLQLSERLRESESRFGRLLGSVETVAVQGYTPDGTIHYWNRASEGLYGYTTDEAVGKNLVELIVPPPRQAEARQSIRHAGGSGETPPAAEVVLMRKDGQNVPVYSSHAAVETPAGMELYSIDVDLTDIRKLEEQLRQSQKMESVGQLAGGVAHDFNNLLQVINGSAELALDSLPEDSELKGEISEIAKAGRRAAQLVSQLLLFSRRQNMQPSDLNLNDVVGKLLKMLGRLLGEHIQLEFQPANTLSEVHADRGMVEQLIMNLSVNARDAMPTGGALTIETRDIQLDNQFCSRNAWAEAGAYVMLTITDTGTGMCPETLQHIFEPFFTTKEVGKGTGLGLATVHGIIEQHNGLIHVKSEVNTGTTFSIYLPAQVPRGIEEAEKTGVEVRGGNESILLAEDNESVCRLTIKILERAGYSVTHARDGLEALDLLEGQDCRYDLLILDMVMPHCGGHEVYQELHRRGNPLPTLFASGYSEDNLHGNFITQNKLTLVQKPFSPTRLLQAVREKLDEAKER